MNRLSNAHISSLRAWRRQAITGRPPSLRLLNNAYDAMQLCVRDYAFRDGARAFRVNRHHRKRAWQERDAAVDGLAAFFSWLNDVTAPRNQTLQQMLHREWMPVLAAALSRPSVERVGDADVFMGLFVFKRPDGTTPWMPSRFKRWSERRR